MLDLKPGVNLLIGDNGAGKTSILDGIAAGLGGLFTRMEGVTAKGIVKDPRWQWNLIDALTCVFPHVQFIIATHAPIILSSAKDAHIILLDENHTVRYLPESYGYTVGDVLAYRQDSIERPRKINDIIKRITDALDQDNIEEADIALTDLQTILGQQNSEYKHMRQMIEDARLLLELD